MTSLAIATWNVLADAYIDPTQYGRTPPALLRPGARIHLIREEVVRIARALDLHAICLQEVDEALLAALRAELEPHGWESWWCPKRDGSPDGCVALIAAPWTLEGVEWKTYARAPEAPAQRLRLSCGRAEVVLYHTHLRWAPDDGATCHGQASQLAQWTRRERAATLVVGDLNSPPGSAAVGELLRAGFRDAHGHPGLRTALFEHSGPLRLDYILVRGAASHALAATEVVVDGIEPLPGPRLASDHIPLAARVDAG